MYLAQNKDEKSQWTVQVPYGEAHRQVFIDYNIGDWVGISTFKPDSSTVVDPYRVMAITVHVAEGNPTLELTLQSSLDAWQLQLQKQLTKILNEVNVVDLNRVIPDVQPNFKENDYIVSVNPFNPIKWNMTPIAQFGVSGGTGTGDGGGLRMFIQSADPGSAARPGDFWLQT